MAFFNGLLALLAVWVLCAFFAHRFSCNAALLPLPVLAGAVLWLWLFGLMGRLLLGGWLFYTAVAAVALWLALKKQWPAAVKKLKQPGFLLFCGASLLFLILFACTQPMFISWDEFTFWGTAAKVTKLQNLLHPAAKGNLQAWSYNPALPLVSYLFSFFGTRFTEWSVYAAYASIYAACIGAAVAVFPAKRWAGAGVFAAACWLLPFVFHSPGLGGVSSIYMTAMGDGLLGFVFGGCLCFYFAAPRKAGSFFGLALCLGFLTLIKDMGLVYALIVAVVAAVDWLFASGKPTVKRLGKTAGIAAGLCAVSAGLYLAWSRYASAVYGAAKSSIGSGEEATGMSLPTTVLTGLKQLVGLEERSERFVAVYELMVASPRNIAVSLLGSGLVTMALIAVILAVAAFGLPKGQRQTPVLLFLLCGIALVGFLVLHLFTYVFIFSKQEALQLKDYARYISPYYMGWALAALGLLARGSCAPQRKSALPRLAGLGLLAAFCLLIYQRGLPVSGFLNPPHILYTQRKEIAARADTVNGQLNWNDTVLLISQGDNATRWNYYGYELNATLARGFGGFGWGHADDYNWDTTHMNLVSPEDAEKFKPEKYPYQTVCTVEDLYNFLRERRYTHILLDASDEYIAHTIAPAFGLNGLPEQRTDKVYLIDIDYSGSTIGWSLAKGGAL